MDVADDIANSVADLTAGLRSGAITLTPLTSVVDRGGFAKLAHGHFTDLDAADIAGHIDDLLRIPAVTALTTCTDITDTTVIDELGHMLTTRFTTKVTAATRAPSELGPHRRFTADLIVPDHVRAEIAVLEALHLHFVLRAPELRARRVWQRHVIDTVFDGLLTHAPEMLESRFATWWSRADTDPARVRVIIDQLAAYTDRRAIEVFNKLTGELTTARGPGYRPTVTGGRPPARSPEWPTPRAS